MPMKPRAENSEPLFAGKYRLIRLLGKGGMGEVWLAEEEGPRNFRRRVALKKLLSKVEIDDYAYESFFSEAHVIARLDHPNIVRLIELGVAEDTVFLALDYVDGPSLDKLIRKSGGPLSPAAVAYVGREVARALEAVHSLCDDDGQNFGVIHRDISPANILLARDARVRLTDFGIAKISGFAGEKTETGVFKGKLPYMPPEQARGEAFDQRADVFSLGITLMEGLIGRRVRKSETQAQLMMKVGMSPVPRVLELAPNTPPALAEAIDAAAAFDPNARTQDAGALAASLDAALWAMGPTAEQEARTELKRRVEATLAALGEAVTGTHRQGGGSQTGGSAGATPAARLNTPRTPISEVHARGAAAPAAGEAGSNEAGPPSSHSAPTVLERGGTKRPGADDAPPEETPSAIPPLPTVPTGRSGRTSAPDRSSSPTRSVPDGSHPRVDVPPVSRRGSWIVLLLVAATAFAGVFLLWISQRPGETASPAGDTSAPDPSTAGTAAPAASDTADAKDTKTAEKPPESGHPEGHTGTAAPPASQQGVEPRLTGKLPTSPGSGAPTPSPAPGPWPPPSTRATAEEPSGPGTLQVVVLPWAEVTVDGKAMGTTPIAPIQLPPGPHSVVLRNAELGASRTLSVVLKPGQPTLLRVDLRRTESP
ncbi:Hypothetical protein CAP_7371 [Chondromyces apiculatus DSM 436]|uniref:Protein kinase domain-containing protein n=2 Tax=Chondromyces apiculatus TaxID=51 RepID=A0A017SZY6_9BACT|nr:Hypothetical protein CAP_7371 [Chondromyces apiculatus DSM 436]